MNFTKEELEYILDCFHSLEDEGIYPSLREQELEATIKLKIATQIAAAE